MKAYTMGARALTENGNQMKEIFLEAMLKEKIITEITKDKMNQYCFVVIEKSFFGKLWDKILWKNKDDKNDMIITVVKVIN